MASAQGEQILLSAATAQVVADELGMGVHLLDLGDHLLKSLSRPERVFQVTAPGLRRDFPLLAATAGAVGNLPVQATPFIGRAQDVARLRRELGSRPLVTLTGPGGVGKTRLALETALMAAGEFPDGVFLIELAPITVADSIPSVVASLLRVRLEQGVEPMASLVDALHGRRLLLVLDNCEHVVDAAAEFAGGVARTCPTVRILATSREPLQVDGERVRPVRSLDPTTEGLEVGDWASEACHLTGRPPTFAVAARFAAQFGDADEAERLARAGIAAAPYPTHPTTSGCHWGYAVAAWYTGRSADTWSRFMTLDSIEPESPLDVARTATTGAVMAAALAPEQTAHFLARAENAATALPSTGIDAMLAWAKSIVLSRAGREAEALEALQQFDNLEDDTTFLPVTIWTSMQRAF